jgi:hypothetical protein
LAYLQEKPELEYTGLESFVFEKYSDHNNTWFPIYKGSRGGNKKEEKSQKPDDGDNDDESGEGGDGSSSDNGGDDDNKHEYPKNEINAGSVKLIMEHLAQINNKIEMLSNRINYDDNETEERAGEYEDGLRLRRIKIPTSPKHGSE